MDISQPLTAELAHWPGDKNFEYKLSFTKEQTGSVNIGEIAMSVHNGTHVDAPHHYDSEGETIDEIPLELYIGKALVVEVCDNDIIDVDTFENIDLSQASRVLLKTALPNNPNVFPEKMPEIKPTVAAHLADHGVKLLGVDLPSVDLEESKDLLTHHALYEQGIYILENLMLDACEPGLYEMIALPLKIVGADASPVRAVIRPLREELTDE